MNQVIVGMRQLRIFVELEQIEVYVYSMSWLFFVTLTQTWRSLIKHCTGLCKTDRNYTQ